MNKKEYLIISVAAFLSICFIVAIELLFPGKAQAIMLVLAGLVAAYSLFILIRLRIETAELKKVERIHKAATMFLDMEPKTTKYVARRGKDWMRPRRRGGN